MADVGNAINKIISVPLFGEQATTRVLSLEGRITGSTYFSILSNSPSYSNGITNVSQASTDPTGVDADYTFRSSVSNGIDSARQETFSGLQTTSRSPSLGGEGSNVAFISSVNKLPSVNGIVLTTSTTIPGDDSAFITNYNSFCSTQLSNSLATGIIYYTMWGLDVGNVPRTWIVNGDPDMTGEKSTYSMSASTIRIINTWVT